MRTGTGSWLDQFRGPSRGVAIAIGGMSLAVSVVSAYWGLPILVFLLLVVSNRLSLLRQKATPTFIVVIAVIVSAIVIPRGPLSLVSGRIDPLPDLLATMRATSSMIALFGCAITVVAGWQLIRRRRLGRLVWGMMFIWVVGSALTAMWVDPEPWIDVWLLHEDAGLALGNGMSPYEGRSVANGMVWFPENSVFEGYVYPPVSLYSYALTDLFLGDSRWMSVAVGGLICLLLRRASHDASSESLAVLLLMSPGWPVMAQMSWTEPLSIALLLAAATASSKMVRAVLTGFFIASKQYLLGWALPLTIGWLEEKKGQLAIAAITIFAGYGIGALYGPAGYIEWAFIFQLTVPDAEVGSGFPGLARLLFDVPLSVPGWLSVALSILVGTSVAVIRPRSYASTILAGTMMTYVLFLTGSQAFPNYWYLVLGGLVITVLLFQTEHPARSTSETHAEVKSQ